jgi:hypothetical protein
LVAAVVMFSGILAVDDLKQEVDEGSVFFVFLILAQDSLGITIHKSHSLRSLTLSYSLAGNQSQGKLGIITYLNNVCVTIGNFNYISQ